MSDFALGVGIFVVSTALMSLVMVGALRRAQQEGASGQALFGRLLPYLLADLALAVVFVLWLLGHV